MHSQGNSSHLVDPKPGKLCPWGQGDHTAPHPAGWQAGQCHWRGGEGTAATSRLGAICQPRRGGREAAALGKEEIFSRCFYPAGLNKLSPQELPINSWYWLKSQKAQSCCSADSSTACSLVNAAAFLLEAAVLLWACPPRRLKVDTGALQGSQTDFGEHKAPDITNNCTSLILEAG